jgi:hypothetical protein
MYMSDQTTPQEPSTTAPTAGAWQDMMERLKRGEREMILAAVACALALLQFFIGATGGSLLTAAMLMNLSLIGWLGNTAHARWKQGGGKGLLALVGFAFGIAAISTLYLAEGLTVVVNTAQTIQDLGF